MTSVESTEKDIETRLAKAWTAINRLSIIWKSDLTDKMKRKFLPGSGHIDTAIWLPLRWTLTKRLEEKKLDGNYTRMLRAILNKSWQQHPTRHQLYGHLPLSRKLFKLDEPDMQDTAGKAGDELIRDVLLWTPHNMAVQKQDDQHEHTFSSYVRIRDVVLKTYLGR